MNFFETPKVIPKNNWVNCHFKKIDLKGFVTKSLYSFFEMA